MFYFSHNIMSKCWDEAPLRRPTFGKCINVIEEYMQKQVPYLDLNEVDSSCFETAAETNELLQEIRHHDVIPSVLVETAPSTAMQQTYCGYYSIEVIPEKVSAVNDIIRTPLIKKKRKSSY